MITRITGVKFHDLSNVAESIVIKNAVQVVREPEWDKEPDRTCDGLAYRCDTKGVCIGYLPLLRTLRKYLADATTDAERERIRQWGLATKAIRQQLKIDGDNIGSDRWTAYVAGLLYQREGSWIEFEAYSDLCQSNPAEAAKWVLRQVSIDFRNVLEF